MDGFMRALVSVWTDSGFAALTWENCVMILVGLVLLYLSIAKEYEPLLLLPIAFGCIMANFPNTGFEDEMGVMMAIGFGIKYEIFPPLIFMGVGAMTDFGPLIANPKTMLLGAAAQIGVFVALAGAMLLGFNVQEAASRFIVLVTEPVFYKGHQLLSYMARCALIFPVYPQSSYQYSRVATPTFWVYDITLQTIFVIGRD